MTLAWPISNDFPQELNIDMDFVQNDNSVLDEMEVGDPFKRLRDTVTYTTYRGWIFLRSFTHVRQMQDFWESESKHGTVPFLFPDPITGEEKLFLLDGSPAFRPLGAGRFRCAVVLREVPQ